MVKEFSCHFLGTKLIFWFLWPHLVVLRGYFYSELRDHSCWHHARQMLNFLFYLLDHRKNIFDLIFYNFLGKRQSNDVSQLSPEQRIKDYTKLDFWNRNVKAIQLIVSRLRRSGVGVFGNTIYRFFFFYPWGNSWWYLGTLWISTPGGAKGLCNARAWTQASYIKVCVQPIKLSL